MSKNNLKRKKRKENSNGFLFETNCQKIYQKLNHRILFWLFKNTIVIILICYYGKLFILVKRKDLRKMQKGNENILLGLFPVKLE